MKKLILIGLILLYISPALAQGVERSSHTNGRDPMRELNLSEDQSAAIKKIKSGYLKRSIRLQADLAAKQHEFKSLIADPAASEESIRTRGREIENLSVQITREMLSFELEVRRILTPEQLRTLYTLMDSPQKKWGKY
ncbi:MAG TPA: Spy/CpxP family protein refolding chaperone [Syntrophales bacterium]|nr:Spy/CpxP family protein refolding chaperone [Syntrophales bacterium]